MLCEPLSNVLVNWWQIDCAPDGLPWGTPLAAILAVVALTALARQIRGGAAPRLNASMRSVAIVLVGLTLALAAERPALEPAVAAPGSATGTVVALLDGSESFWRDRTIAKAALDEMAGTVRRFVDAMPPDAAAGFRQQVIQFGQSATAEGSPGKLSDLANRIAAFDQQTPSPGSNLGKGLAMALDTITAGQGRGVVLLLSDGNFEPPDRALIDEARSQGVAIFVMGAGSNTPTLGLVAADIGPEQWAGRDAVLRLAALGAGKVSVTSDDGRSADMQLADAGVIAPARVVTRFAARGMRYVDLSFAQAEVRQRRRLFTLVRGPARVLAFGAANWLDGLDPSQWLVDRAASAQAPDPGAYDVVVIDSLSPKDFPPGYDEKLVQSAMGTGILLVNGPLRGSVEQEQRIGDWDKSKLSPILPVDTDPRKFVEDPPPRDVVIMVDVSGSMEGAPLDTARALARMIIGKLRDQDSLAIIPFSSDDIPGLDPTAMNEGGKAQAFAVLDGLDIHDGTYPRTAFEKARRLVSNRCSFFFLSDMGFDPQPMGPGCYTYFVPISFGGIDPGVVAMLKNFGEMNAMVPPGSAPRDMKFAFLEPEIRDIYWREGSFRPLALTEGDPRVPAINLPGLAIAYPRADADPIPAIHPEKEKDPVMAFRHDPDRPGLATGAVMSDLSPWAGTEAGRLAVENILGDLTGWTEPERFDIRMSDRGNGADLVIRVLDQGAGAVPALGATFVAADGSTTPVTLRPGRDPGEYGGYLSWPSEPGRGLLVLDEPGHPTQRIPVAFPGAAESAGPSGREAFDFGVDRERLASLAAATGGHAFGHGENLPALGLTTTPPPAQKIALGLWLVAMAALLLPAAFWIGGRSA